MKTTKLNLVLMLTILIIINLGGTASATDYYVATTGSDVLGDGSFGNPWQTINFTAGQAGQGATCDNVIVRGGNYPERVFINHSNGSISTGCYLTFKNYSGEIVNLNGSLINITDNGSTYSTGGMVEIQNVSYINISNINVLNSGSLGYYLRNVNQTVVGWGNITNTSSSCILVRNSRNFTIRGNLCYNNTNQTTLNVQEIISVGGRTVTQDFEIDHNIIKFAKHPPLGGEGIDIKTGASNGSVHDNEIYNIFGVGIYIDGYDVLEQNISVYRNNLHDIRESCFAVSAETSTGITSFINITNNIGINCSSGTGAGLIIPSFGSGTIRNVSAINNDFLWSQYGIRVGDWTATIYNNTIKNNIVANNTYTQIYTKRVNSTNNTLDYNLIWGNNSGLYGNNGTHFIIAEPGFVNNLSKDFHINLTSSARDKGTSNLAPATDYFVNPRPAIMMPDIGIHEYQLNMTVSLTTADPFNVTLNFTTWNITGDYYKHFRISGTDNIIINSDDGTPFTVFNVKVNGSSIGLFTSDGSGYIAFTSTINGDTDFEITLWSPAQTTDCTPIKSSLNAGFILVGIILIVVAAALIVMGLRSQNTLALIPGIATIVIGAAMIYIGFFINATLSTVICIPPP